MFVYLLLSQPCLSATLRLSSGARAGASRTVLRRASVLRMSPGQPPD